MNEAEKQLREAWIDIDARLNLREFLLEQLFANGALSAIDPKENWRLFSEGLIDRIQYCSTAKDHPAIAEVQEKTVERAIYFCEKVKKHLSK